MSSPTLITVCCCFGLLIVLYNVAAFSKLAGPYDFEIKSVEQCDNPGNGEIDFSIKMRKISKYNYSYDINWTLHTEFGDVNGIKVRFDVSKWSFGGWGLNAYVYETEEPCKAGKTFGPDLLETFLSSSGIDPPECPLKPATYYLRNWTVEMNPSYFPELPYGTYKGESVFLRNNERLLCWRIIFVVTEKAVIKRFL